MLASLIELIEHNTPSMRCSVLLLDEDRVTLRHGAAPHLPRPYREAIDGLRIGPGVGSCGTAAYTQERTIVTDIATHEYWEGYRELALSCDLRACWSTPIFGATGECFGTFAMYYDEPKEPSRRDLELIETASRLASAIIEREMQAEALEVARSEAESANEAKSKFLATMSHELRTPLNAIRGYADLLLAGVRGPLSDEQRLDVERIQRSEQHLLGLINDILAFTKLEAGHVEFQIEDMHVRSVLSAIDELVEPDMNAKSIVYTRNIDDPELALRGDCEKVTRILLNLVTNAMKFTDVGGHIDVTCSGDTATVTICVSDTGCGIAPEYLQLIFEPFVQIDRQRTPSNRQGVGLGLSISRELVHAMGGQLHAVSERGKGSTFIVELPRSESSVADAMVMV
jgi:signal transduction histidine kinase